MPDTKTAAILLAAGASTRLGHPKQLVSLGNEGLLHRMARMALEAGCDPVFVVLGFEAEQMQAAVEDLNVKTVVNPDWRAGMSASLRCGIEAIERENLVPERILLLVSDQPRVSVDLLKKLLIKDKEDAWITASRYADRLGVPAVFRKNLYPALKDVTGDQGARRIIQQYSEKANYVDFPEGEIDIDVPSDMEFLEGAG